MPQMINTNIMSLNAQRQLNKSQLTQNEAMERLSSGLRINSAKDDAAGLAISTGMQSQIRGINQAVRNSNDGISMAQTAEGSMDEMTNILQRMRELAVQAANDTNSSENKASIQKEVHQLYSELDRISETTEFNGQKLLDGSNTSTTLQIGANSGESLTFTIAAVTTADLGLNGGVNKGDLNSGRVIETAVDAKQISINGVDISKVEVSEGGTAANMARVINLETPNTGVLASAYNVVEGLSVDTVTGVSVSGITSGLEITVGNNLTVTLGATSSMTNLAETINRDIPGLSATVGEQGNLILNNGTGMAIVVDGNVTNSGLEAATFQGYLGLKSLDNEPITVSSGTQGTAGSPLDTLKFGFLISNDTAVTGQDVTEPPLLASDKITINGVDLVATAATTVGEKIVAINNLTSETGVTATAAAGDNFILTAKDGGDIIVASGATTVEGRKLALDKLGMNEVGGSSVTELNLTVSTSKHAIRSLDRIDAALEKISSSRATLGAIQNRLSSTISNLENVSQNLSASNSRIQDADFAAETSKMSKAQILQQAGTSMLAQANASAQSVLALLQG
ncbi:MAG: flagellin [Psychromonas sp.]|nr:flagellin [Psychromonas sp.]